MVEVKNEDSIINNIICDDVIDGLKKIPDKLVSLTITSPPYNLAASNWKYDSTNDDLPYSEYVNWLKSVFEECYRVTRSGGRLIINIDAMTNRQDDKGEEYVRDIRTDLSNVIKPMGWKFFGEHIWYKSNKDPSFNGGQTSGRRTAWGSFCSPSTPVVRRNHEYILVFAKDTFSLKRDEFSGDPDISSSEFTNWILSTWSIHPETKKLGNHPVPFPLDVPLRLCKLYSYKNDVILDPFSGTGTTALAAKFTGRRYVGIDKSKEYCEYARARLAAKENIFENAD